MGAFTFGTPAQASHDYTKYNDVQDTWYLIVHGVLRIVYIDFIYYCR